MQRFPNGRAAYLKELKEKVVELKGQCDYWADNYETRVYEVISDYVQSGAYYGSEGFFAKAVIKSARKRSLEKYSELMPEIIKKNIDLNKLPIVKNINKELVDDGYEEFKFDVEAKMFCELDSSLENSDWDSNMTDDFESLIASSRQFSKKLNDLEETLEGIILEEMEDID